MPPVAGFELALFTLKASNFFRIAHSETVATRLAAGILHKETGLISG